MKNKLHHYIKLLSFSGSRVIRHKPAKRKAYVVVSYNGCQDISAHPEVQVPTVWKDSCISYPAGWN